MGEHDVVVEFDQINIFSADKQTQKKHTQLNKATEHHIRRMPSSDAVQAKMQIVPESGKHNVLFQTHFWKASSPAKVTIPRLRASWSPQTSVCSYPTLTKV
jgi:hypothetical protein